MFLSFTLKFLKLAVVVLVLRTTRNFVIYVVLQRNDNQMNQEFNLQFGDVLVAVTVVFCVSSLLFIYRTWPIESA